MTAPKLLSTPEAAKLLGVSAALLSNDRTTGRHSIPYFKVGKSVRYREEDVLNWLESRRRCTGEAA
jgi:excisionase family DNA binding protein